MSTTDLKQIERYGKNIRNVDPHTWNKESIKVAELAFREKFSQNPDLKEQLLATFPRTLVYATTKDRFWSIGLLEQNAKAWVMKEWKGDNVLGFILTKIRDKLMENRLEEGGDGQDQRVEGQASPDSMTQDRGGNSHVVERHMSRDSMRQGGEGVRHGVEQQAGRAYKDQGWDAKYQGEEHTSQSRYEQAEKGKSHGVVGQTTHGSNRQDGKGREGGREKHDGGRDDQTWRDRSGVAGEKRGNQVTEGGEYKVAERRSDWRKVAEETEPTSRPKRNMTHQHADHNWNKHETRNMGPRISKVNHTDMPNQDKFVLFFGYQSPFSQQHPVTFTIDGTTFNCAEQYMMFQKTVIFGNKEMERKIMETSNPMQQELYGRQIPEFEFEIWKKHFLDVVDRATEAKFSQNPHLLEHLIATHPKLLVEASPSDRLWGIGRGQKDPLAWDKETWRGKNQLGYIITRVRDRLMNVKDTHWEEWEKWKDDKRWEEEEAREKKEKRRWESEPSDPYRGRHEERTPKTRREGDGVHDGSMMLMKEDSMTSQSRRESYKHVSGKERIELFWGIKSPFSQHYPASFTIDGQTFTSAEHFTLYQMAVIFEDQECQEKIMSTNDPKKQDRYSRKIRNFRWDVWKQNRVQVVERAIIEKFSQNSDLKEQLFATSPKLLAECNYKDVFWSIGYGLGFAKRESEAWDTNKWRGENVLGYTLTAVRDRLMDEKILIEGEGAVGETAVGGEGTQQDRETRI